MKRTHKQLVSIDKTDYQLPANAEIIQFALDGNGALAIWYSFPTEDIPTNEFEFVYRSLHIVGTGMDYPDSWIRLGTCVQGPFVWHLFEGD
jgi:hypothetical protein